MGDVVVNGRGRVVRASCVHCGRYARVYDRGLCWLCHQSPTVRGQYPCRPKGPKTASGKARVAAGTRARHERDSALKVGAGKPACLHCGRRVGSRPRGLCWTCYYRAGVRDRYPTGGGNPEYARRGVGCGNPAGRPPDRPCPHPPGTEGKVAELERRAALGLALFDRADAPLGGGEPFPW